MTHNRSMGRIISLIAVAGTYLFLYVPILVLLVFSFNTSRFPSPWTGFTFNWYRELFSDIYLWQAFSNSLIIAITSTMISIAAGVGILFYTSQGGRLGKGLTMFYGNLVVPETVLAVSLLSLFTAVAIPLGLITLILAHSILALGFVIPITYARYKELDPTLTEASTVLGANPLQTFSRITLPLLRPTLFATALLVFILSFDDFVLSYFCAGSTAQTLSLYILSMIKTGVSPVINALSSVLLCFSSLLVLCFFSFKTRLKI